MKSKFQKGSRFIKMYSACIKRNPEYSKGFTLIELLVVIAIIGILSSVVLASLNSARQKGQIASIKSNLKNMIPQAELAYDAPGNYSTVCANANIVKMLTAITNGGASSSCYSNNYSPYSDVYIRWGASAIIGTGTPIKAYSASQTGVSTWDTQGVNSAGAFVGTDVAMTWAQANTACATAGGRLPTIEELKTLSDANWAASGNTTRTPSGFVNVGYNHYWSNTTIPNSSIDAYILYMTDGGIYPNIKASASIYVRCVR